MPEPGRADGTPDPLSLTDRVTGLSNHLGLVRLLGEEFANAVADRLPLLLIRLELEDWEEFRFAADPAACERILRGLADLIGMALRPCDAAARYNGGGFALVLPGVTAESAKAQARELRAAIAGQAGPWSALSIGLGVMTLNPEVLPPGPADLFRAAGKALRCT